MNAPLCPSPLEWHTLLEYWLGELDPASEAHTEEHYLGCATCSGRLEQLTSLAREVRAVTRESGVTVIVNDQFVRRLTVDGLHVREYRLPLNGSVNCTVAPEDDVVVARLEVPLKEVKRVDMVYMAGQHEMRQEDIPFIPGSGAVVFSSRIDALRALPSSAVRVRLLAVDNGSERTLGEYTFNHTRYASHTSE